MRFNSDSFKKFKTEHWDGWLTMVKSTFYIKILHLRGDFFFHVHRSCKIGPDWGSVGMKKRYRDTQKGQD